MTSEIQRFLDHAFDWTYCDWCFKQFKSSDVQWINDKGEDKEVCAKCYQLYEAERDATMNADLAELLKDLAI